jgi:hypothetical protein
LAWRATLETFSSAARRVLAASPLPDGSGRGAAVMRPNRVVPWFWDQFLIRQGRISALGLPASEVLGALHIAIVALATRPLRFGVS